MGDKTAIAWTDATWNPIIGCSHASAGCTHCYAETMAARLERMGQERYAGLTRDGRWTGETRLVESALDQPLRWRRPRMIFVVSMGDLFHESVPDGWIRAVFGVMAACPRHTFQVLTKRPERMQALLSAWVRCGLTLRDGYGAVIPNVWLGTTVENQRAADERIPHLLATPAAVRWVSMEPLIEAVNLCAVPDTKTRPAEFSARNTALGDLDWVVVGGESGPRARPMDIEWARSVVQQCQAAGVPVFVKQLHLDGGLSKAPAEWPEDLRVREMPVMP